VTQTPTIDPAKAERRARRAERLARQAERSARRRTSRRRAVVVLKIVRGAVRWMPMPVACALGHALGTLVYLAAGRARRQTLEHLEAALGSELSAAQRRRIARRSFAFLGRGAFAFMVAHREGARRALRRCRIEGEASTRAALAEGKGLLMVSFHFGAFEMLASCIGTEIQAAAVARGGETGGGPIELAAQMRRDLGCETIGRGGVREILKALKSGRVLAMLIDQDTSDVKGAFVPYFGRLAHTPLGPAAFAVRTGAPVVLGFIEWEGLTRHRIWALPPIRPRADLPEEDAVLELTHRIMQLGEAEVRRRPDHWVWMHRRWAMRPEENPHIPVWPREAQ
jgi:KDO2-lipid IV(A) lauroyltransferase